MGLLTNFAANLFLYASLALGLLLLVPLKLSQELRSAYFARFFLPVLNRLCRDRFNDIRRRAVSQLNDLVSQDNALKEEDAISVLEIGAGFGVNFEYITRPVRYSNVEHEQQLEESFQVNLKKNSNVKLERWITRCGECMPDVPDASVDAVLLTYILCSTTDVHRVLAECKRVLVKGGRLVFLEHVAQPKGSWSFTLQRLLDPLWSHVFCGCHLTRRTGDVLAKAGFAQLELAEEFMAAPFVLSPHVYGFAVMGDYEPEPGPSPKRFFGMLAENERQALLKLE